MSVAEPSATPVTTPEVGFTEATAVLLLVQFPLDVALLTEIVVPSQNDMAPSMGVGIALIVICKATLQPVGKV